MRKTLIIALGAAVALVTAAVALAAVYTAAGVSATTATLTSTSVKDVKARTCTGADGRSFAITTGRYYGSADFTTPGTELDGPVTLRAKTTVDTTPGGAGLGYVEGKFQVKDDDTRLSGKFWGTLDADGDLAGFLMGSSRGHHAKVLGTLSGKFYPATGFAGNGLVGSASASSTLAVVAGPVCKGPKPDKPAKPAPRPKLSSVKGEVSAIGDGNVGSSITVKAKGPSLATCFRDADSPATVPGFDIGTRVEMKCALLGTAPSQVWTLRELKKHS